ncbi:LytR C-terminal domain-containing protein [Dermacoccaceae bacterium W4C1]
MGRTRRLAAPLLAVALTASLVVGCSDDEPTQTEKTPTCPTTNPAPSMKIAANTIFVNVINAGGKSGLASSTATQLQWRGFRVLDTGNQSIDDNRAAPTTAEIRYGPSGRQIALTLAQQVANVNLVQVDRANPTVDLVLGEKFALVPVPPPAASSVTLNVYNTTYRSGLSGEAAEALKKRGFKIKANDNDPGGGFFPNDTAIIRHGERGEPAARRAALQIKGARLVQDKRTDTVVDVLLGNKYTGLVPESQATPAPTSAPAKPSGC